MRSLWLLNELQIPFELVDMPFDLSVMRSADYLAVHPLGRVPCLVEGDFRLFESGAIAEYLCESYAQKRLGRLGQDPERYEWLQWIHYSETMAVHAASLVQAAILHRGGRSLGGNCQIGGPPAGKGSAGATSRG